MRDRKVHGLIVKGAAPPAVPPTLTTERLTLRPLAEPDWPAFHAFACDPEVQRWQLRPADAEPALRRSFQIYLDLCASGFRRDAGYAVVSRATGALVGVCMSVSLAGRQNEAQFGFLFDRAYWNRGYATEASRALLGYLFGAAGVRQVMAGCYAGNPASARVLAKLGMRRLPLRFPAGLLLRLFPARRARTELWHVLSAEEWRRAAEGVTG